MVSSLLSVSVVSNVLHLLMSVYEICQDVCCGSLPEVSLSSPESCLLTLAESIFVLRLSGTGSFSLSQFFCSGCQWVLCDVSCLACFFRLYPPVNNAIMR